MKATTPLSPLDEIRCKLDADHMKVERYWLRRSIVCSVMAGVLFLAFCVLAVVGSKTASVITMGLAFTLVLLGMELSRAEYEWAKRLPQQTLPAYRAQMLLAKQASWSFHSRTRPLFVADLEKLSDVVGEMVDQEFCAAMEPIAPANRNQANALQKTRRNFTDAAQFQH